MGGVDIAEATASIASGSIAAKAADKRDRTGEIPKDDGWMNESGLNLNRD
jgi:hypothetical protein